MRIFPDHFSLTGVLKHAAFSRISFKGATLAIVLFILLVPGPFLPVSASPATKLLSKEGNFVILNTTDTPLRTILDSFSELLQADIYLVGGSDQVRITRYQRETDPLRLLSSVIKPFSYAIVYRERRGRVHSLESVIGPSLPGGEVVSGTTNGSDTKTSTNGTPEDSDSGQIENPESASDIESVSEIIHRQENQMRRHFEKEIENLRKLMDNGEAENFYPDPEARLADLEKRLEEMPSK